MFKSNIQIFFSPITTINSLLIGSFFWISASLLVWQGSITSIILWVIAVIWFISYLYIISTIQKSSFGPSISSIAEIIFSSFSRPLSFATITLLLTAFMMAISSLAILFHWLISFLAINNSHSIQRDIILFIVSTVILRYLIKYWQYLLAAIQLISIMILSYIAIVGLIQFWNNGLHSAIRPLSWYGLPEMLGLLFFHFATLAFWSASKGNQRFFEFTKKVYLVIAVSIIQIILVAVLPYFMDNFNLINQNGFILQYIDNQFSTSITTLFACILMLQVILNGSYCLYSVHLLIKQAIALDYRLPETNKHFHLRNFSYSPELLVIAGLVLMGWLIITRQWDLLTLMYIGGNCVLVVAIVLSSAFLKKQLSSRQRKFGLVFAFFNLLLLPFFSWFILIPASLLFSALVMELMSKLRYKELPVRSKSQPRWWKIKLNHFFYKKN